METKNIRQRRIKIGSSYYASGYGRGINKRNVYLIDGKCYAYHPQYCTTSYNKSENEFKGYIPVNFCKTYKSFHSIGVIETHGNFDLKDFQD